MVVAIASALLFAAQAETSRTAAPSTLPTAGRDMGRRTRAHSTRRRTGAPSLPAGVQGAAIGGAEETATVAARQLLPAYPHTLGDDGACANVKSDRVLLSPGDVGDARLKLGSLSPAELTPAKTKGRGAFLLLPLRPVSMLWRQIGAAAVAAAAAAAAAAERAESGSVQPSTTIWLFWGRRKTKRQGRQGLEEEWPAQGFCGQGQAL